MGKEIERKYLIAMPDVQALRAYPGCTNSAIVQTYLLAPKGDELRVRQRTQDGQTLYVKTLKRSISGFTREEIEETITKDQYDALLAQADPACRPIEKTRYALPYNGHVIEVDLYPFFTDCAIAEVELSSETEAFSLPACIRVIREVTDDPAYKNAALARR